MSRPVWSSSRSVVATACRSAPRRSSPEGGVVSTAARISSIFSRYFRSALRTLTASSTKRASVMWPLSAPIVTSMPSRTVSTEGSRSIPAPHSPSATSTVAAIRSAQRTAGRRVKGRTGASPLRGLDPLPHLGRCLERRGPARRPGQGVQRPHLKVEVAAGGAHRQVVQHLDPGRRIAGSVRDGGQLDLDAFTLVHDNLPSSGTTRARPAMSRLRAR